MLKLYIHRLWLKIIKRASEVCKCKANRIKKRQLLENICVWFEQLAVSVFMVTGPVLVHGCVAYLTADHASFTGRTSSQSHPFQWQHLSTIIPCGNWGTCGEHTDMGWFPSLEKLALKLQTWLKQSPQEQGAKIRQIMGELWQGWTGEQLFFHCTEAKPTTRSCSLVHQQSRKINAIWAGS